MKRFLILLLLALSTWASAGQQVTIDNKPLNPVYTLGVDAQGNTVTPGGGGGTVDQGAAGTEAWPVTGTTLVQISQTLDALLAASGGGGDVNLTHIDDTSVANQSNAPGWMPSALGDGFGNPIDSVQSPSTNLNGLQGLVTDTTLYAQYQGFSGDNSIQPLAFRFPSDPWNPDQNLLSTSASLDAVGGVAVTPALRPGSGFADTDLSVQVVASVNTGFNQTDDEYEIISSQYEGDGQTTSDIIALATGEWFWGGVALAPAQDLDASTISYPDFQLMAPAVMAQSYWQDTPNDQAFATSVAHPLPTTNYAATLSATDTFTATGNGATQTFTAQNYTWQVRSDDPASIGLTFTIILENSIDGGTTWQTLDTKTEADVSSAPTTITAKPGSTSRTRCSALNLGATATNVSGTVLAAM